MTRVRVADLVVVLVVGLVVGLVAGCASTPSRSTGGAASGSPDRSLLEAEPSPEPSERSFEPSATGEAAQTPDRRSGAGSTVAVADGKPRRATLRIPSIGVTVAVVPYRGWTDDAPGTRIQDRGLAASPYGPRGGVGPGGIGNYQVTAHRTSSTRAFADLPALALGERVVVDVGERRYVYRVTGTRETSFRSAQSLREQRAAVPGRPGAEPTMAMITLSTCATPEDRAAGNTWTDRFGNPEHRIDKIGRLVAVRARSG